MDFPLREYTGLALYSATVVVVLLTIFWRPIVGLYSLLPLIPLQTMRYRLNAYPFGQSVVGIMIVAIILGIVLKGKSPLPKTPWTRLLCIFGAFTYLSLWWGTLMYKHPYPLPGNPRFGVWTEYLMMPLLVLLVAAIRPSKKHIQSMLLIMCLSTYLVDRSFWNEVSGRDYSSYSEDLRNSADGANMGYAGVNGIAAFDAQAAIFLIALAAFEKRQLLKYSYWALAVFTICCLAYSLSRGGYLALLGGWLFMGIVRYRFLLVLLAIFLLTWTVWLPTAVTERVTMTYNTEDQSFDPSAETRLTLWDDALAVFSTSPLMGTGFNTYAYMHRVRDYEDTHNYYLKVLVEMGILGLLFFVVVIARLFWVGFKLYRTAKDPLYRAIGLGLAGWLACAFIANCFGDRWTYLQVDGYMWILAGFVAQAWLVERNAASESEQSTEVAVSGIPQEGQLATAG